MSEWTVDTLREHLTQLMSDRFATQNLAIDKAERAAEKRFDSINEFRGQLSDQANTFMPRAEVDQIVKALEDKISGKNIQVVISLSVGVVAALIAVFNLAARFQ